MDSFNSGFSREILLLLAHLDSFSFNWLKKLNLKKLELIYKYGLFNSCTWCGMHQNNIQRCQQRSIWNFLVHITSCTPAEKSILVLLYNQPALRPINTILFVQRCLFTLFLPYCFWSLRIYTLIAVFIKIMKWNDLSKGHLPMKIPSPGNGVKYKKFFHFIYLFYLYNWLKWIFSTTCLCFYRQQSKV